MQLLPIATYTELDNSALECCGYGSERRWRRDHAISIDLRRNVDRRYVRVIEDVVRLGDEFRLDPIPQCKDRSRVARIKLIHIGGTCRVSSNIEWPGHASGDAVSIEHLIGN